MKCKYCGAEIESNTKFCAHCGSQISLEMRKEQEQLNKKGCPKCGSSSIEFNREDRTVKRKGKNTKKVKATVGVCHDCGYTWQTAETKTETTDRTWLWVVGWILIFPVPLTILMLRNDKLEAKVRYIIIGVAWAAYILLMLIADLTRDDRDYHNRQSKPSSSTTQQTEQSAEKSFHIFAYSYGLNGISVITNCPEINC